MRAPSPTRAVTVAGTTHLDVTLGRGLGLSGVVATSAGLPSAGASVTASVSGGEDASAETDEAGHFTLGGLTPGRYAVTATSTDGEEATLEDVDPAVGGTLRLVLQPK